MMIEVAINSILITLALALLLRLVTAVFLDNEED